MTGSSSVVVTVTNPFVGPRFIETGQKILGRDREIEQLYYLLSAERVVLLHSPSGAGKSSLIRAGLIPRLKEPFDVWGPTRVSLEPPEGCPIAANRFVQSVNLGFEAGLPEERQRPAKISAMGLSEHIAGRPRRRSASPNIVLIFDQFEEILTVDPLALEAKHEFFDQVGKLLQDPHVWALFALREDYLAPLDPYAEQVPTHLKNRFRLDLLGREAAGDVIARSVEEGGRTVAPEAVEKLVNNLATMQVQRPDGTFESQTGPYVEPLHLQVACRELWNRLPEDRRTIDVDDIQLFGDVTKALADYYEKEVAEIAGGDARVERAIREWVGERLITADGIRGQVLKGAGESEGLDNELIGRLVNTHLVRGEQRAGATWYELSHDRLIEPVRTNNKEWFEAHLSKVQKVASVWAAQGRPEGLLLLGGDLVEARQWAQVNESSLTGIERRFLEASEAKQEAIRREQRQTKRLRLALGIAIVLAIAALFATWKALKSAHFAQQQLKISNSVGLATAALLHKDDQLDLASLLSVEAVRTADISEARNALFSVFEANPRFVTYLYHSSIYVRSVAFSPDGKTLASADAYGAVRLWDVASRQPLGEPLKGYGNVVWIVVLSLDGKTLASVSNDNTVRLWDVTTGQPIGAPLKGHNDRVHSIAFSPDGRTLASASGDNTARLWNVATGQPIGGPLTGHSKSVNSVAFSPDGKTLASVSNDNTVRLWDVTTGQPIGAPLKGHNDRVHSIAFSPDGRTLASASGDNTARLWNVATGQPIGGPLTGHSKSVNSVAFSPDGRTLASASADKTVRLWGVATGQPLGEPLRGHNGPVMGVAFSPDGKTLASASTDYTVRLWDLASHGPLGKPLTGSYPVNCVAFSPNGKTLASGSWDHTVRLWDVASHKSLGEALKGHGPVVVSLAFSPDGRTLASASSDETVRLWDTASPQDLGEPLKGHGDDVNSVAFSPDGKMLASASSDETVRLWDVASHKPIGEPLTSQGVAVKTVIFSPDGKTLASTSVRKVLLWDVASHKPIGEPLKGHIEDEDVDSVAFSPDGKMLASVSDKDTVRLWDVASRQPLGEPLNGQGVEVDTVVFSPDGKMLASLGDQNSVRLWEVASRQPLGEPLKGHTEDVNSVAFSPDGKTLASASLDNTVRLWDVASRQPLGEPLEGHTDDVMSVAFSPDGKTLASASRDKIVRLWDLDPISWASRACQRANRNLSQAEWNHYIGKNVPYHRTCPNLPPGDGVSSK